MAGKCQASARGSNQAYKALKPLEAARKDYVILWLSGLSTNKVLLMRRSPKYLGPMSGNLENGSVNENRVRQVFYSVLCALVHGTISVVYYENEYGSRVFFEDLGRSWLKHRCREYLNRHRRNETRLN